MPSTEDSANSESPTAEQQAQNDGEDLKRFREQILSSTPEVIIANHCFGLFELAAIYLSETPPRLTPASLVIDALSGITASVKGRLGDHEQEINDGISQLRLAYVQLSTLSEQSSTDTNKDQEHEKGD